MRGRRRSDPFNDSDRTLYEVRAVSVRCGERILRRGHLLTREEIGTDVDLLLAAGCIARTGKFAPPKPINPPDPASLSDQSDVHLIDEKPLAVGKRL